MVAGKDFTVVVACRERRVINVKALVQHMHIWVERVSSEDNIADLPSRCSYELLKELNASWTPPILAKLFVEQ